MITLITELTYRTHILARTVSNPVPFTGFMPTDRNTILQELKEAKSKLK